MVLCEYSEHPPAARRWLKVLYRRPHRRACAQAGMVAGRKEAWTAALTAAFGCGARRRRTCRRRQREACEMQHGLRCLTRPVTPTYDVSTEPASTKNASTETLRCTRPSKQTHRLRRSACAAFASWCHAPLSGIRAKAAARLQHATCSTQHATCSMQHAACSMQHAACNMRHAADEAQPTP